MADLTFAVTSIVQSVWRKQMEKLKLLVAVLKQLCDRGFFGQIEVFFENGEPLRYYLKESRKL